MADGVDVADLSDARPRCLVDQPPKDELDRGPVVPERGRSALHVAAAGAQRVDGFAADALDAATGEPLVAVGGHSVGVGPDELKLERRGASVENEDVHGVSWAYANWTRSSASAGVSPTATRWPIFRPGRAVVLPYR